MSKRVVEIDGRRIHLSNLEKDLYPPYGFTKAHILEYYSRIAPVMLPHLKDRALTMKRYPEGAHKEYFFEKRCPSHRPEWVKTAEIPQDDGERIRYCVADNLETLIWVENLASIELHVPLGKASSPGIADSMVFDLDPGEPANLLDCARVALILRELLSHLQLTGVVKSSGKKGLHLYVPLNNQITTFDDTKRFSRAVAEIMQKNYPDVVTAKMAKQYRQGKVFINWSQNDAGLTMVCVYSLRAREKPYVSFPLKWTEIESSVENQDAEMLQVTHSEAVSRAEKEGDLFKEVLTKKQKLPHL